MSSLEISTYPPPEKGIYKDLNPGPSHFCWGNPSLVDHHHFLSLGILNNVGPSYQVRSLHHLAFGCPLDLFHWLGVHFVHFNNSSEMRDVASPSMFTFLDGLSYVLHSNQVLFFLSHKVYIKI